MFIRDAILLGLVVPLAVGGPAALAQTTAAPGARSVQPAALPLAGPPVVDPAAPVPALLYRSAFADTPAGVETGDVDWKKANADVGQFQRGHIDILQWENRKEARP